MKKLIAACLALLMVLSISFVFAESIDLSSLSFDELATLETRIIKAMMSKPEYKETKVPVGVYKVGEDIPAGKWTISGIEYSGVITWGTGLDEYGVEIPYNMQISSFSYWDSNDSIDWDLVEGTYISVAISPVKFSPYIPKSLGF